jgi:hypothetical protein
MHVFSKILKKRLPIALAAGILATAMVPGLASASPGLCEGSVGPVVKYVASITDDPMGGPNSTWGWAHPDGKPANPGQAMQYFCFER